MKTLHSFLTEAAGPPADVLATLASLLRTTEKNAVARAMVMGLTPVCGRCGGSGQYSFNLKDGTRCYGCNGSGHVQPKSAEGWKHTIANAQQAASSGHVETYIDTIIVRKQLDGLWDQWHKLWTTSGVSDYKWSVLSAQMDKASNGNVVTWSHLDESEIRNVFLSELNAYYAKVSDVMSALKSSVQSSRPKMSAQQYTEWMAALQLMLKDIYEYETKLRAGVKHVDQWAHQAKNGQSFPMGRNRHGLWKPLWVPSRVGAPPDIKNSKFAQLWRELAPKSYASERVDWHLTWPHDE